MSTLAERLRLAAAAAYVEAHSIPADPERYAQQLDEAPPEALAGIVAEVPLADLLEAAREVERAERLAAMLQTERNAVDSWLGGWSRARAAMREAKDWRAGASAALAALHISRPRTATPAPMLADAFAELAEQCGNPREAIETLAAIESDKQAKRITPAAIQKRLHRAGVKNLPRID